VKRGCGYDKDAYLGEILSVICRPKNLTGALRHKTRNPLRARHNAGNFIHNDILLLFGKQQFIANFTFVNYIRSSSKS
jgi:hypothetical protein